MQDRGFFTQERLFILAKSKLFLSLVFLFVGFVVFSGKGLPNFGARLALADTAEPTYAGTGANFNDSGTTAWTNPTNIQGDTTGTAATVNIGSNGGTSQKLRATNFGFSIPANSTITGVTVEVENNAANNNRHYWNNVQLIKGGTETGNNNSDGAAIPTGKAFKTFGSSSDDWGANLTSTDVNASNFGVSLKLERSAAQTTTTSIYRVRITITYTPPITVSGTVYLNDESTSDTNSGVGYTVKLSVAGATAASTTSSGANGTFSFSITPPSASTILTLWLDTGGASSKQGSLVLKYGTSCTGNPNCTGLKIVRDQVRLNNSNGTNLTNTDLSVCDNDSGTGCTDADIGFTSNSGVLTATWATNELKIANGTFAPGGNVSVQKLDVAGTYTGSSETLTLSGNGTSLTCTASTAIPLCVGGTFTASSNTVTYISTSATNIPLNLTYSTVKFQPTSGSPTYTLGTAASQTLTATSFTIGDGSNAVTTQGTSNNPTMNISGTLLINGSAIFQTGSGTITLSATGTPLSISASGTFTASTNNTIAYSNTTSATVTEATYYNLTFTAASGTPTYTLATTTGKTITVNGNFSTNGAGAITVNANTNDPTFDVNGDFTIGASDTFITSNSGTFTIFGSYSNSGTVTTGITGSAVTFDSTNSGKTLSGIGCNVWDTITFNGSGGTWSTSSLCTSTLVVTAGTITVSGGTLYIGISMSGAGTVASNTSTTCQACTINNSGNWTLTGLVFGDGGSQTQTLSGSGTISTDNITISNNSTLNAGSKVVNLTGTSGTLFTKTGTFNAQTSTFNLASASGSPTVGSTSITFYDLAVTGAAAFTAGSNALSATNTLTVSAGSLAVSSNVLTVGSTGVTNSGSIKVASGASLTAVTTVMTTSSGGSNCIGATGSSCSGTAGTISLGMWTMDAGGGSHTITVGGTTTITAKCIWPFGSSSTFNAGSSTLELNGTQADCSGGNPFFANGGTFNAQTSTVKYTGDGAVTIANFAYNNLSLSPTISSSQTYTMSATTVGGNFTVNATKSVGLLVTLTVNLNAALTVTGNTTITHTGGSALSIVDTSSGSNYSFTTTDLYIDDSDTFNANNSSITVKGNFTDFSSVGFNPGNSTVHLTTTANATLSGGGNFWNLDIPVSAAGKVVSFENTGEGIPIFYIANNFTAIGTSGSHTTIQSSTTGTTNTQWFVHFTSAQASSNFNYIDLKNSGCDPGTAIADMSGTGNSNVTGNDTSCWSFVAAFSISGTTDAGNSITVSVAINGTKQAQTGSTSGGSWSISGIAQAASGDIITLWLDTATTTNQGTSVTKYVSGNLTSVALNKHTLTIGHGSQSLTVTNLGLFDRDTGTGGGNVMHTANSSVLTVDAGSNYTDETISILSGATLTVGGTETLSTHNMNAIGNLTSGGSSTYTISGNWVSNSGFSASTSTTTFTATDSGHTIDTGASGGFNNVVFNGSGGVWSPINNSMNVNGDLTITAGTLDNSSGSAGIGVAGGDVTGNGTINLSSGTFNISGTSSTGFGSSTNWTFNNLSPAGTITAIGSGTFTVSGTLAVGSGTTFNAGSKTIILSGTGTVFGFTGATFNADSSTFQYTNATSADITAATYYNLILGGTGTYTMPDSTTNIKGNLTVTNNATVTKGSGTVVFSGSTTQTITDNNATKQDLGNIQVSGGVCSAFPCTSVLDDFNRSDGGLGSNWGGQLFGPDANLTISGQRVTGTGGGSSNQVWNSTFAADSEVYAEVAANASSGQSVMVALRFQAASSSNPSGYAARANQTSGNVVVFKFENSLSPTILGTITQAVSDGDKLGLRMTGSLLEVFYKVGANSWGKIGEYTDSSITGGGYIGLNTTGTSVLADNFGGGSVAGGVTTLQLGSSVKATSITVDTSQNLDISSQTLTLTGTSTPLTLSGSNTFTVTGSTVDYTGNGASTILATTYNNLGLKPSGSSQQVLGSGTFTINGNLTVGNGTNNGASAQTNDPIINVTGTTTVASGATFTNGTGNWNFTGNLTVNGTVNTGDVNTVTVNGDVAGTGTITKVTGTFEQRVSASKNFGTTSGSNNWDFAILTFSNSNGGATPITITLQSGSGTISSHVWNIAGASDTSGATTTLSAGSRTLINGRNSNGAIACGSAFVINTQGIFTASSSTVSYECSDGIGGSIVGTTYNNLNVGTITNSTITPPVLTLTANTVVSGTLTIGNTGSTNTYTVNTSAASNRSLTVGTLLITSKGALTGNASAISVSGNWTNSGTFTANTSNVTFTATATGKTITSGASNGAFYDLTFNGSGGGWTLQDNPTISHVLTITAGNLDASSRTITLSGSGTPFVNSDTFTQGTSTVSYTGTSATNITALNGSGSTNAYYNLSVGDVVDSNSVTYTLLGDTRVNSQLTVSNSGATGTDTLAVSSFTLTLAGSTTPLNIISGKGAFSAGTSMVTYTGTPSALASVNMTSGNAFNNLTINSSGTATLGVDVSISGDLSVSAGTLSGTNNVTVNGAATGNGTINLTGGTFTHSTTTSKNFGSSSGWTFYDLTNSGASGTTVGSGAGGITVSHVLTLSGSHILDAGSKIWTLSGTTGTPFSLSGTLTPSSSTFAFTGNNAGGNTTVPAATYNNLIVNNSSETFVLNGATVLNGDMNITAGILDTVNGQGYGLNVAGNWTNAGTFTPRTGLVTFTATNSGHTINNNSSTFNNVTFNGSNGVWSPLTNTMTLDGDLTMTAGTLDNSSGSASVTVNGGDVTGNGTINLTAGTFTVDGASGTGFGGTTTWTFNNLSFTGASSTTTAISSGGIIVTSVLSIGANHTLNAGSKTWTLSGTGTPFVATGTFTASNSTIKYTGNGATNIAGTSNSGAITYNNLESSPAGAVTHTLGTTAGQTITISGNLEVGNSSNNVIIQWDTNDPTLNIGGNFTLNSPSTWTKSGSATMTFSPSATKTITDSNGTKQDLGNVVIASGSSTPRINLGSSAKVTTLSNANSHILDIGSNTLTLTGNGASVLANTGTFTAGTNSTVDFSSASTAGTTIPALTYYNLTVNKVGNAFTASSGSLVVSGSLTVTAGILDLDTSDPTVSVTGNLTVGGTLTASNTNALTLSGNFTNNGTFTHSNGTVSLTPSGYSTTVGGSSNTTFYNLSISNQGNKDIKFQNGRTFGITHDLTATGSNGNNVRLVSDSPGSQWTINYSGSSSTINYVYVQDSACSGSNVNTPNERVYNGGNNGNCWRFVVFGGGGNGNGASGGGSGGGTPPGGGSGQGGGSGGSGGGSGGSSTLPETFTGSDGTALTTYSSSWTLNNGNYAIHTNAVRSNSANIETMATWNVGSFSNDQYAQITISAVGLGSYIGVTVRGQTGAFSGYGAYTDNTEIYIVEWNAGVANVLYTGIGFAQNDVLRLEIQGSNITLKKNGSTVTTVSDGTYTSGRPGLSGYGNGTTTRGDNFNAGSISQGGGGGGSP